MPNSKFEIIQHIACLSGDESEWAKELNLVSWYGKEPKYDIRSWSQDHTKMGRGATLTKEELENLKLILEELL